LMVRQSVWCVGVADLHAEAVPREAPVALPAAVGAAQRLDDLDEHAEGQAVGAQLGALLLVGRANMAFFRFTYYKMKACIVKFTLLLC